MTLAQQIKQLVTEHGADAVAAAMGALTVKTCQRCGNTWTPRQPGTPRQCPACKSTLWQTARGEAR